MEGLGIMDLDYQNQALLLKWLWTVENRQDNLWAQIVKKLHGWQVAESLESLGLDKSFFLKDLTRLLPFYKCSVTKIGPDTMWKWTTSGAFSCSSAYRTLHHTGVISATQSRLWRIKVPMKVRIFIWLMLDRKILTQRVLMARGCMVTTGCHLCQLDMIETRDHIMWNCIYAVRFWTGLLAHYNISPQGGQGIGRVWVATGKTLTKQQRSRWDVIWASGTWALWRERNRRLFSNKQKQEGRLINDTALEIDRWVATQ